MHPRAPCSARLCMRGIIQRLLYLVARYVGAFFYNDFFNFIRVFSLVSG